MQQIISDLRLMTLTRLLFANLLYHWRGNLAVLLGVAVGTAVLTGALLVGDSLRGSLRSMAAQQLGWVELALVNHRFFREELAGKLNAKRVSPAILLQSTAAKKNGAKTISFLGRRIQKVNLIGVDGRFWDKEEGDFAGMPVKSWNEPDLIDITKRGVVLSAALADDLNAKPGDYVAFFLEKATSTPRESLMGRKGSDDVLTTVTLLVKAVLPEQHFGSRFTLKPSHRKPRNAFVPLQILQEEVYSQQPVRTRGKRFPRKAVNAVFAAGADKSSFQGDLKKHMQLLDWGLVFRTKRIPGYRMPRYLSLESRELFLPPVVVEAVQKSDLKSGPTLVYLVNNIAQVKHIGAAAAAMLAPPGIEWTRPSVAYYAPFQASYNLVAALDPAMKRPLGPFVPPDVKNLADDEIMLIDCNESSLGEALPGDLLALTYYEPDSEHELKEVTKVLKLRALAPIDGPAGDPYLTPVVPGVTDTGSKVNWDLPFPFDKSRVKSIDERFFDKFRTTPQAYVSLETGRKLWKSRFGDTTSIRIAKNGKTEEQIADAILAQLKPEQGGLAFQDIKENNFAASAGSNDFGMLFLGFSFFLIVAALLLIGLLFRLNIDRRASELGLLLAVGQRRRFIWRLLLAEGLILSLLGGVAGCAVAVAYAGWLLGFLRANWPGGLSSSFLGLHVTPFGLVTGYGSAVVVSLLTILWGAWSLRKLSPRALLGGETSESTTQVKTVWRVVGVLIAGVSLIGAAVCFALGFFVQGHEARAGSFMGSGFLLLTAGLALVWLWLKRPRAQPMTKGGLVGLAMLGVRNAGRNPARSLLTMGLLASATFLIVAVQSFNRNPGADFLEKTGGSGGFPLLAETSAPVFLDLNSAEARAEIAKANGGNGLPDSTKLFAFRVKEGDDASCLNLYKPGEPRLLGVPSSIIERGGFAFAGTLTQLTVVNPWHLLEGDDTDAIPVFGEANSVTYALKSYLGGIIEVTDDRGRKIKLRIVGLLRDSVFQNSLIMSDANFRKAFPQNEGFRFFLIETASGEKDAVQKSLTAGLSKYGIEVHDSKKVLQVFLDVQNTYLLTFQALGGLGLLLGVLGLAVVLLRSVWERRGELALMRALGFRRMSLGWLVLAENSYLLILGLGVGAVAALVSVAPHVVSGAHVPWLQLAGLLCIVFIVGLGAGTAAVVSTLRAPLLPALRRE